MLDTIFVELSNHNNIVNIPSLEMIGGTVISYLLYHTSLAFKPPVRFRLYEPSVLCTDAIFVGVETF